MKNVQMCVFVKDGDGSSRCIDVMEGPRTRAGNVPPVILVMMSQYLSEGKKVVIEEVDA